MFKNVQLDQVFFRISSKMAEPICQAYGLLRYRLVQPLDPKKFDNLSNRAKEVAFRTLIGLGTVFFAYLFMKRPIPMISLTLILVGGSRLCRWVAFALQKRGYTHLRGSILEKETDQLKVMNWNICGLGGNLSLDHGGVISWRRRLQGIVDKIVMEDPDVLVLEEVYDEDLAEALVSKLKNRYAHFYMHLGKNIWGSWGGGMVMTKCSVHGFSFVPFQNNSPFLARGFSILELKKKKSETSPFFRILGTHFIHGNGPGKRKFQMEQMATSLDFLSPLPTILAGDLNIERDKQEGREILSPYLDHCYVGKEATWTNELGNQWKRDPNTPNEEAIDYISFFRKTVSSSVSVDDVHLVKAYDETYNTKTALSDHHGLVATFSCA